MTPHDPQQPPEGPAPAPIVDPAVERHFAPGGERWWRAEVSCCLDGDEESDGYTRCELWRLFPTTEAGHAAAAEWGQVQTGPVQRLILGANRSAGDESVICAALEWFRAHAEAPHDDLDAADHALMRTISLAVLATEPGEEADDGTRRSSRNRGHGLERSGCQAGARRGAGVVHEPHGDRGIAHQLQLLVPVPA